MIPLFSETAKMSDPINWHPTSAISEEITLKPLEAKIKKDVARVNITDVLLFLLE